jgi:type IV pilus assembly protein PilV
MALLEGLLAILIFSLGILGLIGMQGASMRSTTLAKMRIDASLVADEQIGRAWLNHDNLANFTESNTPVPTLPNGKRTTVVSGNQLTVTVSWEVPGDSMTHSYRAVAQINAN